MTRRTVIVLLPILLLLSALGQRLLQTGQARQEEEDRLAADQARLLVLRQFRAEVESDAYASAQKYVRSHLLTARSASHAQIQELTLTHLKPHRYKVQGEVMWIQTDGKPVRRRVEADLQHGPMDQNWYLLDTEFLTVPPKEFAK